MWDRQQYEEWLATLRMGGAALSELDDRGADLETRRVTALNIQIAWAHLNAQDSPCRAQLTDSDRRTVAVAQAITGFVDYGIVHDHGPARISGRIYPGWRVADDCKEIEWQRHSLLPPHRVKACVLQQGRRNQGTAHSVRDGYGYVHEWTQ